VKLKFTAICCFILSFALVLLSDGGVYPLSLSLAVLLMAVSVVCAGFRGGLHPGTTGLFVAALFLWFALTGWIVIQATPLPADGLGNPAWAVVREAGISVSPSIAVVPGDAVFAILPISLSFMTFLASLLLFRTDQQVQRALQIWGTCGAAFAMFAILQAIFFPTALMFGAKQSYFGSLTAPFVNRNTAATFYGLMLASLIVSYAMAAARNGPASQVQVWLGLPAKWVFASMALIVAIALALTQSRGGALAATAGCGVLAVVLVLQAWCRARRHRYGRDLTRWRAVLLVVAAVALVVVAGSFLFGRAAIRTERQGLDDTRLCVARSVLPAIADNWGAGTGPSSFRYYFPAYRSAECGLQGTWYRAHNFYVETILALGSIAALFAFVFAYGVIIMVLLTGLRRRRRKKPLIWGGIAALVIATIHSFTDFSLQIPGFSMQLAFLIAVSLIISTNNRLT